MFRAVDSDIEKDLKRKIITYKASGLYRTELFDIPNKFELINSTEKPYY